MLRSIGLFMALAFSLLSAAGILAVRAEALQGIAVEFPQNAKQTLDQALREAFSDAIQQMMPPQDADNAREQTKAVLHEVDTIHERWREAFNELSRQVTTAQKVWQQASKELGDGRARISNLQVEILKKKREHDEVQAIDSEYQQQVAVASKWYIVVPFDVTYPYAMPHGQALDAVEIAQLEHLIELGRGRHIQAVDVVEQGVVKQSLVRADVSGKLIPVGETVIQKLPHPRRDQRHIIAVRTFSVLPLLSDEQPHSRPADPEATAEVILNNSNVQPLDADDESAVQFLAQFGSNQEQEIRAMIRRTREYNNKTQESLTQLLSDWKKARLDINPALILDEIRQAEEILTREQAKIQTLEETERRVRDIKQAAEQTYKAHLQDFRIFLHKSGTVNVGELNVIDVSLKKALELYEALIVEASENRYKATTLVENFAVKEDSMQQELRDLKLLELRLLPIGSYINAEGQEIISLTLLGTYGSNGTDTSQAVALQEPRAEEGILRTALLPGVQQTEPGPLQPETPATVTSLPLSTPQQEMTREQISQVQGQLQILGFNPGPADGALGPRTQTALRHYQSRYGLAVTGVPDAATRQSLESQLEQQQANGQLTTTEERRREAEQERLRRQSENEERRRMNELGRLQQGVERVFRNIFKPR